MRAYRESHRKKRNKKVEEEAKLRIEVSYGSDEQGNNVSSIFECDEFRIVDGTLFIENEGKTVYANKNAWLYLLDIDNAQLLRPTQEMRPVQPKELERAPSSSVMPELEPA